jgi:hypothetical protein
MTTATFSPDREAFRAMLATLADKTKAKIPALNGRVEKAVRLALAGDVELHENGTATVYSSSDPTRRYEIIEGTCTCRDYEQAPQHLCQHRLSAGLVRRTYELLPPPPPVASVPPPVETTPLPAAPPLPEAPASVNVRLMIDGRDCQLTLRDSDEGRLLERLAVVLAQHPIAASTVPQEGWCAKHGVQMTQTTKDGRSWWSHRQDGQWCKGR